MNRFYFSMIAPLAFVACSSTSSTPGTEADGGSSDGATPTSTPTTTPITVGEVAGPVAQPIVDTAAEIFASGIADALLAEAQALPQLVRHDGWDWHLHATTPAAP